mmetsp:Transcript_90536/g.235802  ORF Transcript_90536/g.235802 Transcript_90536/m.235802 type:complete len:565 (+) Transcript_90536:87-1781(+)
MGPRPPPGPPPGVRPTMAPAARGPRPVPLQARGGRGKGGYGQPPPPGHPPPLHHGGPCAPVFEPAFLSGPKRGFQPVTAHFYNEEAGQYGTAIPPWMGGVARKRRLELSHERGLPHPGIAPCFMGSHKPPPPPPGFGAPPGGGGPGIAAARRALPGGPTPASAKLRAAQRAAPAPPEWEGGGEVAPNTVRWMTLNESSTIVQAGLPDLAPAIVWDANLQSTFSSSKNILYDLLGESADSEVQVTHDPDWVTYPEVGEALKILCGEDQCICVATCPSQAKWAVGGGNNWKKREQAAKLSLCIALAANAEDLSTVSARYPEFAAICESAGITTDSMDPAAAAKAAAAVAAEEAAWAKTGKRRKKKAAAPEEGEDGAELPPPAPDVPVVEEPPAGADEAAPGDDVLPAKLPRDVPAWLTLQPDGVPDVIEALATDALVVATDLTSRKGLYNSTDSVLAALAGEHAGEVQFHDDAEWKNYPGVGDALKQLSKGEECMTVAVCMPKAVWAVGVGMKGKCRYSAAKLALATAMALQQHDLGEEEVDLSEFSHFQEFVDEARESRQQKLGF